MVHVTVQIGSDPRIGGMRRAFDETVRYKSGSRTVDRQRTSAVDMLCESRKFEAVVAGDSTFDHADVEQSIYLERLALYADHWYSI